MKALRDAVHRLRRESDAGELEELAKACRAVMLPNSPQEAALEDDGGDTERMTYLLAKHMIMPDTVDLEGVVQDLAEACLLRGIDPIIDRHVDDGAVTLIIPQQATPFGYSIGIRFSSGVLN